MHFAEKKEKSGKTMRFFSCGRVKRNRDKLLPGRIFRRHMTDYKSNVHTVFVRLRAVVNKLNSFLRRIMTLVIMS